MDIIKESIALLSDDTLSLDCDSSIMTLLDFFFFLLYSIFVSALYLCFSHYYIILWPLHAMVSKH